MARLALAAGKGASFDGSSVTLAVDRRTAEAAAKAGGETVLLYQVVPESFVLFVGRGRVAGVDYGADRDGVVVRIDRYEAFAASVPGAAELNLPRVRSMLRLDPGRFAEIEGEGRVGRLDLAEARQVLRPETYVAIRDQVRRNWGHRCAVTGRHVPPGTGRGNGLDVVAIRPRDAGGPLHVRNFLPLVPLAARAWERGDISAGPDLDIVAVPNRLDPDLLAEMLPSGRLLVPRDPLLGPDPAHLAFHRTHVFAG